MLPQIRQGTALSVAVLVPSSATVSAEGRLIKGGPFPASATAQGFRAAFSASPATASAEGPQLNAAPSARHQVNGAPSLRERVRVRGLSQVDRVGGLR